MAEETEDRTSTVEDHLEFGTPEYALLMEKLRREHDEPNHKARNAKCKAKKDANPDGTVDVFSARVGAKVGLVEKQQAHQSEGIK